MYLNKIFFSIGILLFLGCSAPKKPLLLVEEGNSKYLIVTGENCIPSESIAAHKLREYIYKSTGVKLEIITDKVPETDYEIVIGKTNREGKNYSINRTSLGEEGYEIKTVGTKLVIAGGIPRGTLYGVIDFLEEYVGCRFFTSYTEKVPQIETLAISTDTKELFTPLFEYRRTSWYTPDTDLRATFKLADAGEKFARSRGFISNLAVHTSFNFINPNEWFESHPDYFSLRDGIRTKDQLCYTHPDVLDIITNKILQVVRENPIPEYTMISISQEDSWGDWQDNFCTCDNCLIVYEEEGSPTGTMIRFINEVAETVGNKYPNVELHTLSYKELYTEEPPKTAPAKNVIIQLCSPIPDICGRHSFQACETERMELFRDRLDRWIDLCNTTGAKLYLWDYTFNVEVSMLTLPNFDNLYENYKYIAEKGFKGVFAQGDRFGFSGEFGELRLYLIGKMLWKPLMEKEVFYSHMDEFLEAYYGNGWKNVRDYIDLVYSLSRNNHINIRATANETISSEYRDNFIEEATRLWDNARNATNDESELARIKRSRLQLTYYILTMTHDDQYVQGSEEQKKKNDYPQ